MKATINQSILRVQESAAPPTVPTLSTAMMATADGDLNRELLALLTEDPPDARSLTGKRIAIFD